MFFCIFFSDESDGRKILWICVTVGFIILLISFISLVKYLVDYFKKRGEMSPALTEVVNKMDGDFTNMEESKALSKLNNNTNNYLRP